jgi:serine/threonine-protein kinase HipA
MNRKANIYWDKTLCGFLEETEEGYLFYYKESYIQQKEAKPVSKTLPLQQKSYHSKVLFPFFDGLIPEGWLLNIAEKHWKVDKKDRLGLLLATCKDTIGAVSVEPINEKEL